MTEKEKLHALISSFARGQDDWERIKIHFRKMVEHLTEYCAEYIPALGVSEIGNGDLRISITAFSRIFHMELTPVYHEDSLTGHCALYQCVGNEKETLLNLVIFRDSGVGTYEEPHQFYTDSWTIQECLILIQPIRDALNTPQWQS